MKLQHVTLLTNQVHAMQDFYKETLELPIINATDMSFEAQIGASTITFQQSNSFVKPFYHFAIDIPANQFNEAKQYIVNKVPLLTEDGQDEVYFEFSNARSLYFEDPSGNIIEWIARLEDNPKSTEPFSSASLIGLSEMSFAVHDKITIAKQLKEVGIVDRSSQEVAAEGLTFMSDTKTKVYLLLTSENRKWLFSEKVSKCFPVEITTDIGLKLSLNENSVLTIQ